MPATQSSKTQKIYYAVFDFSTMSVLLLAPMPSSYPPCIACIHPVLVALMPQSGTADAAYMIVGTCRRISNDMRRQ